MHNLKRLLYCLITAISTRHIYLYISLVYILLTREEALKGLTSIDLDLTRLLIVRFIREYFTHSGARAAIVGLSGGLDSSVTAALLTEALGKENVRALILPYEGVSLKSDIEDAISLCESLGVKYEIIDIRSIVDTVRRSLEGSLGTLGKITLGNIMARTRMILLYAYANCLNGLVVGTSDKSEILLGYFTKYGDGAADIMPIGDLYKTQVRLLAMKLGIPERIVSKASSPGFWTGHLAEDELGARYEDIDCVLYALIELGLSPPEVTNAIGIKEETLEIVLKRLTKYKHKRRPPVIPRIQRLIMRY